MVKSREIPIVNYIKLIIFILLTIVGIIFFRSIYIQNMLYEESDPLIRTYISASVNTNEIYNYIRENENSVIYMCASGDNNCKNFEKSFGPFIEANSLRNVIKYLNINGVKSKKVFIKEFNKFYGTKIEKYPCIIIFEDGKVKDVLTIKIDDDFTINTVKAFLVRNNVSESNYD